MMAAVELVCVGFLLAYLIWVPLPFGSIVAGAFLPLVIPPMVLCGIAALLRSRQPQRYDFPRPLRIWSAGSFGIILIAGFQLVPWSSGLLSMLSPESSTIWSQADRIAALGGVAVALPAHHPITIDPHATARELLRLIALAATLHASAFLIVTHARRVAFAVVLAAAGFFEAMYGVREALLERYEIWGWRNHLIYGRATGTFVNPNHYAHYLALTIPMTLFVAAVAWHKPGVRALRYQIASLAEWQVVAIGAAGVVVMGCIGAMLLSQSRGTLLATVVAFCGSTVILTARRSPEKRTRKRRAARLTIAAGATAVAFIMLILLAATYLGRERTVDRFRSLASNPGAMVGRRAEIMSAVEIWRRFPVFGCGAGAFDAVVAIAQRTDLGAVYQHAHDDYVEFGATTGLAGFMVAMLSFFGGLMVMTRRLTLREIRNSWRGRAFTLAAVTSIFIAATHALFDFNFFMPSNATTIVAIAGAAAALRLRESSSAPSDDAAVHPE